MSTGRETEFEIENDALLSFQQKKKLTPLVTLSVGVSALGLADTTVS